jgi:hypothetical protein
MDKSKAVKEVMIDRRYKSDPKSSFFSFYQDKYCKPDAKRDNVNILSTKCLLEQELPLNNVEDTMVRDGITYYIDPFSTKALTDKNKCRARYCKAAEDPKETIPEPVQPSSSKQTMGASIENTKKTIPEPVQPSSSKQATGASIKARSDEKTETDLLNFIDALLTPDEEDKSKLQPFYNAITDDFQKTCTGFFELCKNHLSLFTSLTKNILTEEKLFAYKKYCSINYSKPSNSFTKKFKKFLAALPDLKRRKPPKASGGNRKTSKKKISRKSSRKTSRKSSRKKINRY